MTGPIVYTKAGKNINDHESDKPIVLINKIPIFVKNINTANSKNTPAPNVVIPPPFNKNRYSNLNLKLRFPYELMRIQLFKFLNHPCILYNYELYVLYNQLKIQ